MEKLTKVLKYINPVVLGLTAGYIIFRFSHMWPVLPSAFLFDSPGARQWLVGPMGNLAGLFFFLLIAYLNFQSVRTGRPVTLTLLMLNILGLAVVFIGPLMMMNKHLLVMAFDGHIKYLLKIMYMRNQLNIPALQLVYLLVNLVWLAFHHPRLGPSLRHGLAVLACRPSPPPES